MKSRFAKAAGAEPAGEMRDEKVHAIVARSKFRSQNVNKTHQLRTTFGKQSAVHSLRCFAFDHIISYNIIQYHIISYNIIEGSLEVKLPTICRDEKAVSREKSQKRKDQKKEETLCFFVVLWLRRVEK